MQNSRDNGNFVMRKIKVLGILWENVNEEKRLLCLHPPTILAD